MHFSLKVVRDKKFLFLLFAFCVLHIFLMNINVAEWGDSYRILRASEFVRDLTYPIDEKRPPLFSIFLAMRPSEIDAVVWAKWFIFFISVAYFVLFYLFLNLFEGLENKLIYLALLLFMLNPVFLYWSIRIMADVFFAFLVLACLFFLTFWRRKFTVIKCCFLAFLTALAIFTRFEGYILFASVGFGILFSDQFPNILNWKALGESLKMRITHLITYTVFVAFYVFPYLLFRNPFRSTYLEEPGGRAYDLKMVLVYVVSFLFLFGFAPAVLFLTKTLQAKQNFFVKNPGITMFILLELVLILLWPAAIPRLFVSIIPLLIIPLVEGIGAIFEKNSGKTFLAAALLIIGIYAISQFYLKLQFLVLYKVIFVVVILIQLLIVYAFLKKKYLMFVFLVSVSMFIWSLSTIYLHKDIYQSIKRASLYANAINCNLAHNDTTSIAEWYLFDSSEYIELENSGLWDCNSLINNGFSCLIFTNEHNVNLNFNSKPHYCLRQINEFRYKIDEREFFSKVYLIEEGAI